MRLTPSIIIPVIRPFPWILLGGLLGIAGAAFAGDPQWKIEETPDALRACGKFSEVEVSLKQPQFLGLKVDSLGLGRFSPITLKDPPNKPRPAVAKRCGDGVEYRALGRDSAAPARWKFEFTEQSIRMVSQWSESDPPESVVLEFNTNICPATLLGVINPDQSITLPALLHLPDRGTFRITALPAETASLAYDAADYRTPQAFARVSFPPATKDRPRVEYRWEVAAIYPKLPGIENDPRFNGFRRNWMNMFQVNPRLQVLANNTSIGDTCPSCVMEFSDVALYTPESAGAPKTMDLIRQLLEHYIAGKPSYGLPGNGQQSYPFFLDAYPNLLIGAFDYTVGSGDQAWLEKNYPVLRRWAETLLATDRNGNGLFEYEMSGNSGAEKRFRPSNWWDCINFGHEDAYANALAYRALRGMEKMAGDVGKSEDAARYRAAADKLRAVYVKTFFNPATGVLAGWKSADGQLHDYYFLFVNGAAIHYGLVPKDQANAIMDKLLAKMKEVGYTRFDLGLPGNLIPVAKKDYWETDPRFGGGRKEDNSDGFQIYENGGATACWAYFTLAALYDLDRREEADRILFPMLDACEKGGFQGAGPNGMTKDWKTWDGTCWGYELLLPDNYYAQLAVLAREGALNQSAVPHGPETIDRK